jgi:hypothetical protein
LGALWVLNANIRLGLKGLPRTNTLAYFVPAFFDEEKKFCNIVTRTFAEDRIARHMEVRFYQTIVLHYT